MANAYTQIFRQGTYAQYQALAEKNDNLLYFCTDNGKLYKGSVDFTDSFVVVTAENLPATGVASKIYYISDQAKFKTYLNGAYVEIGNPIDKQGSSSTSTITDSSTDDHVPSAKNVYTYGQEILAAIGGEDVVKEVEAGTASGKVKVTKGDDSSAEFVVPDVLVGVAAGSTAAQVSFTQAGESDPVLVTVPGVITDAVAGSNAGEVSLTNSTSASSKTITVPGVAATIADKAATDAAFTVTPTTGDAYDVTVSGVVTTPTWNTTNRILTLPVSGGQAVEVNIGRDLVLKSGYYDTTAKEIVLVLNDEDETEIRVDVTALIDIYTGGETSTVSVDVSSSNVITAAVKLDQAAGNAIEIVTGDNGGLRVDLSDYALDENLQALATATTTWGTFS